MLTIALYSRADSWLGWGESRESDNVLRSLGRIFQISMHGLWRHLPQHFQRPRLVQAQVQFALHRPSFDSALPGRGAGMGRSEHAQGLHAQPQGYAGSLQTPATDINAPVPPGQYHDHFTLADAGVAADRAAQHRQQHNIYFTLPETHVVGTAKIHIYYAFSPSLIPQLSHLKLIMNGTLFATIQPTPGQFGGSDSRDAEAEFTIPPELLVHNNTLTIEFIGHYTMVCEDPANTTLWARVHRNTYIDIRGDLLPLADDLKQLPMPFVDPAVIQPLSIPVVFPVRALVQSHSSRRHRHQLLRHDLREPPGAFPGAHRSHPAGQRHRHCRESSQSSRGPESIRRHFAHRGHARPTPTIPTASS